VGSSPSALAVGAGGRLYVANTGSGTVSVIDTATNKVIDLNATASGVQSITVGSSPSALVIGTNGRLYVANRGSNTVSVINTATNTVTASIAVGSQPTSMALGPQGRLYVVNTGASSVSVIDTTSNSVVGQAISVGPSPTSVAFSPDGALAYVTNANDTISMIDAATNTVVRTAAFDTDTAGGHVIAVAPNGTVYVTDAADKTVRVLTVSYGNTAPVAGTPTVSTNTATGVVTGALNFTDAEQDALSYSVTQPTTGTVNITSAGVYTFTPTPAARAAAATGGPTTTTFTVTATDGQATASVNVTVGITAPAAATSLSVLGSVSITGFRTNWPPVLSPDGTRAVMTSYSFSATGTTTRVAVVNVATGKQVGSTLTLAGTPGVPVMSADGTQAFITTSSGGTSQTVAISTATGALIGTMDPPTGDSSDSPSVSADTTLVTTRIIDPVTGVESTELSVMDAETGAQIGTTFTLRGGGYAQLVAGDSQALLTTTEAISSDNFVTRVAVISTSTGLQTGATLTLNGAGSTDVSADGKRALLTVSDRTADNRDIARVAVIDTTTGMTTFTPLTFSNQSTFGSRLINPDGSRALIVTNEYDGRTSINTTRMMTIDTATGAQIGTTTSLTGFMNGGVQLSPDGRRAVVITASSNFVTTGVPTTQVAVINPMTGTQIGTTLTLNSNSGLVLLSADGSRAVVVADTQTLVINTSNGARTNTVNTSGIYPQLTADGTRVVMVTGSNPTKVTVLKIA
jgi:YVTN family beta-propeller protein/VCBS repeat-containing protein